LVQKPSQRSVSEGKRATGPKVPEKFDVVIGAQAGRPRFGSSSEPNGSFPVYMAARCVRSRGALP